jgi:hypothetical protein
VLRTITIPIGDNTELVEPYEIHVVYIEAGFASKRYFGLPKNGAVGNRLRMSRFCAETLHHGDGGDQDQAEQFHFCSSQLTL